MLVAPGSASEIVAQPNWEIFTLSDAEQSWPDLPVRGCDRKVVSRIGRAVPMSLLYKSEIKL